MTRPRAFALSVATWFALSAGPQGAPVQNVLVLCTADKCDYSRVAGVVLSGHSSVRIAQPPLDPVSPETVDRLPEVDLLRLAGLYRDAKTAIWYDISEDTSKLDLAVPLKIASKYPVPLASVWQGAGIEYVPLGAKSKLTAPGESFAYLLVSPDADQAVSALFGRLLRGETNDARRVPLIRGALKFSAKPQTVQAWRAALLGRINDDVQRFDAQTGDPVTLADTLREAVLLKGVYSEGVDDPTSRGIFDHVTASSGLFAKRLAVANAFRAADLWDEYLVKLGQLGLARWSLPDALAHEREALAQSTALHMDRSKAFARDGHPDRAFDEAALAARHSCDSAVLDTFYRDRIQLVNHNEIASAAEYSGKQRAFLEQIVRGLEQLDPNKEQVTLDQIRQGEAIDPDYLPLQWKKADFLDKLGRYTEALAVLQRIERSVPLDRAQLNLCLGLDAGIRNNLLDAIGKSTDETRKAFDDGRYQDALTAAARGLKANPADATLLYYSAMSAGFLRQTADATKFIRTYLQLGNMTCAGAGEPEKVLDLNRIMATPGLRQNPPDSIPNWVSGARYRMEDAFYDPISLAFLQPVTTVVGSVQNDSVTRTVFQRENRSFLVSSIVTFRSAPNVTPGSATTTLFAATPKYDRQTLAMLEIGPGPAAPGGAPPIPLTYLNSPNVDPGLVLKFTGKQVARGWAGNPYFHPFVWSGLYAFDLTYDGLGRVVTATPVSEAAGSRTDPFSEPLEFTWYKDTNRLLTVHGKRTGYLRQLFYDKSGLLVSEAISLPKHGEGSIEYEYLPHSAQLRMARCTDNFWDGRERMAYFDSDTLTGR